jgi:hypothetical protein
LLPSNFLSLLFSGWPFSTSFYYAVQALLGVGFGVPSETNEVSYIFSILYIMSGTTMIAGSIGNMCSVMMNKKVKIDRKYLSSKSIIATESKYFHITKSDIVRILFCCWILLGAAYAYTFEGFGVIYSIYFAISAMSTCGMIAPACDSASPYECNLGYRGYFIGVYCAIGVPLYGLCLGELAGWIVQHSMDILTRKRMVEPLTELEFDTVSHLLSEIKLDDYSSKPYISTKQNFGEAGIDLGNFVVYELLRLQKLDIDTLNQIKKLFSTLDEEKSGQIIFSSSNTKLMFAFYLLGIITRKDLIDFGLLKLSQSTTNHPMTIEETSSLLEKHREKSILSYFSIF